MILSQPDDLIKRRTQTDDGLHLLDSLSVKIVFYLLDLARGGISHGVQGNRRILDFRNDVDHDDLRVVGLCEIESHRASILGCLTEICGKKYLLE